MVVKELSAKKSGHPHFLGKEFERRVKAYVTSFRQSGAVVNSTMVVACAEGIVKSYDSNLMECNGGCISLSKSWAKHLVGRMRFVKRQASMKAKVCF